VWEVLQSDVESFDQMLNDCIRQKYDTSLDKQTEPEALPQTNQQNAARFKSLNVK
jgi:hypothetical protein